MNIHALREKFLRQKMAEAGTPKDIATLKSLVESHGHTFPKVPKSTSIMIWPIEYIAADDSDRKAWKIFHGNERIGLTVHIFDTITYEPIDEEAADFRYLKRRNLI